MDMQSRVYDRKHTYFRFGERGTWVQRWDNGVIMRNTRGRVLARSVGQECCADFFDKEVEDVLDCLDLKVERCGVEGLAIIARH